MLSDDDRDYADLLFVRTRSGDPALQQQAWQDLESWASTEQRRNYLKRLTRADVAFDQVVLSAPPAQKRVAAGRRYRLPSALAASLALLMAGLWWLNPSLSTQRYSVEVGQQREVQLADGSRVVLNTASAIEYNSRLRSRDVRLVQGEALFDVAHAVIRPFTVQAADARVRVVGTLFSVYRLDSGSRIKVANGRVEVRVQNDAQPRFLNAGEQLETAAGSFLGDVRKVDVASIGNWSGGRLVFDALPLKDALAELQRYRKAPILLLDDKLADLKLTGSFSSNQPDRILELLPVLFKVKVSYAADGTARIARL